MFRSLGPAAPVYSSRTGARCNRIAPIGRLPEAVRAPSTPSRKERAMSKSIQIAVLAAGLALPCAATAAVDYFLKIDGIEGEATAEGHKGEIAIESWSWGVSQTSSANGSGARTGKPCTAPVTFTKMMDKASPQLMAN